MMQVCEVSGQFSAISLPEVKGTREMIFKAADAKVDKLMTYFARLIN